MMELLASMQTGPLRWLATASAERRYLVLTQIGNDRELYEDSKGALVTQPLTV
jgi:hypothetical protein